MSDQGWYVTARSMIDHPLLQEDDAFRLWHWLLAKAQWKPTRINYRGQAVALDRGQVAISVLDYATERGISHKRMRLILEKWRTDGMVNWGKAKGKAFTVVTICKYDDYQAKPDDQDKPGGNGRANEGQTEQQGNKKTKRERPASADPAPVKARGSRLETDWKPDEVCREYARSKGFNRDQIDREAERFVNYWTAKSGKDGTKLDWHATWRNWVMDGPKGGRPAPPRPKPRLVHVNDPDEPKVDWAKNRREGMR